MAREGGQPGFTDLTAGADVDADRDGQGAARSLVDALRRRLSHTIELAAVEVRYAGVSALAMMLLVILSSAAIIISWGLIVAALLAVFAAAGYSWPAMAVGLAVLHALGAIACWQVVVRLSRNLSLPALRAALGEQRQDEG